MPYEIFSDYLCFDCDAIGDRQTHPNSDRPSTTNPVVYDLRGAAMPTAHAYVTANLAHEVHGNQITQPEELL